MVGDQAAGNNIWRQTTKKAGTGEGAGLFQSAFVWLAACRKTKFFGKLSGTRTYRHF